ncbi:energy-converting hydrogenase A subunit A EhaA [uncultured Methanobrevibacter sp.]|uniref:energy-converting hydrogenase A subunit A EhaA n=1 Tax=uncultured Methanobrevibacter sp. TaxID=253161 RepID=UPI0026E0CAA7|nr:energy-converting hydrogenase A subunit A EhaA [uncultured Methanobrevibacter sp.]
MLNLILDSFNSVIFTGAYNGIYTSLGSSNLIIDYLIVILVSIIFALILRLPLLPSKPYRYSFDVSALYPTPIIAIGVLSLFFILNYSFAFEGKLLALIIGICSALFVKYLFFYVFPKPPADELNGGK